MNTIIPFDPIQRSKDVESLVMQGDARRYYRFRFAKFYGGIITCDASGCNLLCGYCWNIIKNSSIENCKDKFFSPDEVASKVKDLQLKHEVNQFRISGCEAILGETSASHLGEVIKLCKSKVVVETNGIMLGKDPSLLDLIPKKNTRIRVTIKADSPKNFEAITGAKASAYKYQIKAIQALTEQNRPFTLAFMKQFVDMQELGYQIDKAGFELNDNFAVDVESLLYYPQNTQSMKDRGVKPLYRGPVLKD
jgi:uncharacterized Fe-S cluster-containing radical SAM superfamily protein